MSVTVGRFNAGVATRQVSRWTFELLEPLTFHDPVYGEQTAPAGFVSDLASVRVLRNIAQWALLIALLCLLAPGRVIPAIGALIGAVGFVALVLYAIVVGYCMRAAIIHDWLYKTGSLPRGPSGAVLYRAAHLGDGTAAWRSAMFWAGVRVGGAAHYKTA